MSRMAAGVTANNYQAPGPPDNGQNRFLGQEISFHIPGKCHVRNLMKQEETFP